MDNMQGTSTVQSSKPMLSPDERKIALLEARFGQSNQANNIAQTSYSPNQKIDSNKENMKENSPSSKDDDVVLLDNSVSSNDTNTQVYDNRNSDDIIDNVNPAQQQENVENLEQCWSNENNSKSNLKRKLDKHDLPIKSPLPKASKLLPSTNNQQQVDDSNQGRDDSTSRGGALPPQPTTGTMLPLRHYFAQGAQNGSSSSSSVMAGNHTGALATSSSSSSSLAPLSARPATTAYPKPSTSNQASSPDWKKQVESLKSSKEIMEGKLSRALNDLKDTNDRAQALDSRTNRLCKELETVHRKMAIEESRRRRDRLALDCVRLGKNVSQRMSHTQIKEVWEEGYALKELSVRREALAKTKDELESRRRRLTNLKRGAKRGTGGNEDDYEMDLDLQAETEAIRAHFEQHKKDEMALAEEVKLLEAEKAAHQRELKRCFNEDQSRFQRDLPFLNNRYVLLSLLGKGGFSEVWKALDVIELKEVALKVHQLNVMWNEDRKQSYIKHVTREYKIHRELRHPRVVQFYDVFEIDVNSFATVLEYCRGTDLDERLKREKMIPEKEARVVLLQMISALRYFYNPTGSYKDLEAVMNNVDALSAHNVHNNDDDDGADEGMHGSSSRSGSTKKSIIHYDLKPGNILFDEFGDAKVTDFGLSKVMEGADDTNNTSLELTSQGAGTYWYLPPECMATGDEKQRISTKVDIWSLGVIYYQMIYGKKPFGEGKSQEKVLTEGIILNAHGVDFPANPKISDDGRDFIKVCLTHDQRYRPDVLQLCQHPYVRKSVSK